MADLSKDEYKLLCDLWTKLLKVSRYVSYMHFYYDVPGRDEDPDKFPKMLTEMVADISRIKRDLMGFIEQDLEERFLLEDNLTALFNAKNV